MAQLKVLRTAAEVEDLILYLKDKEIVAYDCETTGIVKGSEVIGYSVCAEFDVAYYVVISAWDKEQKKLVVQDPTASHKQLIESLKGKSLVMHNAVFDCSMAQDTWGVELMPSVYVDTLLLAHLLDENRRVGLKELGISIFGEDAAEEQRLMKASVTANGGLLTKAAYELYKADADLLGRYGAQDTLLTLKLLHHFLPDLYDQKLEDFFFEETMPLLRTATYDLNRTGLKVDTEKLQILKRQLETDCLEAQAFIQKEVFHHVKDKYPGTGKTNHFNIGSSTQLAWLLFDVLRNPFGKLTEEGRNVAKALQLKLPYTAAAKRDFIRVVIENKDRIYEPATLNPKTKKMSRPKKVKDYWNYTACGKETLGKFSDKYKWVSVLLKYSKDKKLLNTYVEGIEERMRYGIIHPSFLQHGTTSGRYSSKAPNFQTLPREDKRVKACIISRPGKSFVGADYCLHPDSEVLTEDGWANIMSLKEGTKVWQVDKTTLHGDFVEPIRLVKRHYQGKMNLIGNKRGKICVTDNHTMLYSGQNSKTRKDKQARRIIALSHEGIPSKGLTLVPHSFISTKSRHSSYEIWTACAIQADGSKTKTPDTYRIQVSYPRKRNKLSTLLGPGNPAGYIRDCHTLETESWRFWFKSELLTGNKGLCLKNLGTEHAPTLVSAISFWDGSRPAGSPNRVKYFSKDESTVDEVQSYLVRSGWEATKQGPNKNGVFVLSIRRGGRVRLVPKTDHKTFDYSGSVGCVTVPSGFILVRYKGFVAVTGNCQLEPRVFASISQDTTLMSCFSKGDDFYSVVGAPLFGVTDATMVKDDSPDSFPVKYKKLRDRAKVVALATPYGRTAIQQSDAMGISIEESQEIIDRYFEAYPKVELMMLESHEQAKANGVVYSIYGRPRRIPEAKLIPSRYGKNTPHGDLPYVARTMLNLSMNHRIQSTGASIMNRAAIKVWQDCRELEAVDPAWKEVKIVLQVHDEIILEGPDHLAEDMCIVLRNAMETTVELPGVSLEAVPKIAKNIADLK